MIVSNEPGYYKAGEYGIRIENLVLVKALEGAEAGEPGRHMMGFGADTANTIGNTRHFLRWSHHRR